MFLIYSIVICSLFAILIVTFLRLVALGYSSTLPPNQQQQRIYQLQVRMFAIFFKKIKKIIFENDIFCSEIGAFGIHLHSDLERGPKHVRLTYTIIPGHSVNPWVELPSGWSK